MTRYNIDYFSTDFINKRTVADVVIETFDIN